jgi:hypothetical protein
MADPDWWARGIALASAAVSAGSLIWQARSWRKSGRALSVLVRHLGDNALGNPIYVQVGNVGRIEAEIAEVLIQYSSPRELSEAQDEPRAFRTYKLHHDTDLPLVLLAGRGETFVGTVDAFGYFSKLTKDSMRAGVTMAAVVRTGDYQETKSGWIRVRRLAATPRDKDGRNGPSVAAPCD